MNRSTRWLWCSCHGNELYMVKILADWQAATREPLLHDRTIKADKAGNANLG